MSCVKVSISFPKELLEKIDKKAEKIGMRRSKYLQILAYNDLEKEKKEDLQGEKT